MDRSARIFKVGKFMRENLLFVGVDVGSTTTKVAALDAAGQLLYADYQRHHAAQVKSVREALEKL